MVQDIEELRKEKEHLLRREDARKSLLNFSRQRNLERRRLKAEIKALKNPGSQTAKNLAKNLAKRSGKILFKNAVLLGKHLSTVAAEQNKTKPKRKKKKSRRKR